MIQKIILFYILQYIILINNTINDQHIDTIIYNAQNNDKNIKITRKNGNHLPICFHKGNNDANVRKCIGCQFSTSTEYTGIYNIISTCTFTCNEIFENIDGKRYLIASHFYFYDKNKKQHSIRYESSSGCDSIILDGQKYQEEKEIKNISSKFLSVFNFFEISLKYVRQTNWIKKYLLKGHIDQYKFTIFCKSIKQNKRIYLDQMIIIPYDKKIIEKNNIVEGLLGQSINGNKSCHEIKRDAQKI